MIRPLRIDENGHSQGCALDCGFLERFFLSLSDETVRLQNHFGEINDPIVARVIAIDRCQPNHLRKGYVTITGEFSDPEIIREDEIVAYAWLDLGRKRAQRFTCSLGIVVTDAWQGKHIGTDLTKYMISEARKLGMRKLWVNCYTDNLRALYMYRGLGFEQEGLFRKQEYTKDNLPRDLFSLALFLE